MHVLRFIKNSLRNGLYESKKLLSLQYVEVRDINTRFMLGFSVLTTKNAQFSASIHFTAFYVVTFLLTMDLHMYR